MITEKSDIEDKTYPEILTIIIWSQLKATILDKHINDVIKMKHRYS